VDLATFQVLLTPAGQELIQAAYSRSPRESDFLIHLQTLSRRYPAHLARAALEIAILRLEARDKFPFAERLFFTRQAMEQASSYTVSSYRAARFREFSRVADLGCSAGADTIALAKLAPTLGLDLDLLRLRMAAANLEALGLSSRTQLLQADLTLPLPLEPGSSALFFDPARRSGHRRIFSVQQYQPPLSVIEGWLPSIPAMGVKISPGVALAELDRYDAEVEFISLQGELKEAVLWFGALKTAHRRATLLPGPHQLFATYPSQSSAQPIPVTEPGSYLYEPDPAVIRSGLVDVLAQKLDASQLDPEIAYLTSSRLLPTPFARSWVIEDWLPFQLKRLRLYLRQRQVGRVTVKKRGSPLEPQALIHQLRLKGDQERILVLTHLRGEPIVLICNGL
jgi:SAM-dependent methyltransferase